MNQMETNKMTSLNLPILIVKLNVNCINSPIKRRKLSDRLNKPSPNSTKIHISNIKIQIGWK